MVQRERVRSKAATAREADIREKPSRTLPTGDVFRARLILALGDGISYREIAKSLKTNGPTIARWKMCFEQDGMAGVVWRSTQ
jgi:DNA invertase Pin-like site-specific DNA recombinase